MQTEQNILKGQLLIEKVRRDIQTLLQTNKNGNERFQNLWDAIITILRGTFTAASANIKIKTSNNNAFETLRKI